MIEAELLASIKQQRSTPAVADELCRQVRARLREMSRPAPVSQTRIAQLEAEVNNLVETVAGGALRGSSTLAARRCAAESELARLKELANPPTTADIERLLPDLAAKHARSVERLPEVLASTDTVRARTEIAAYVGPITAESIADEIRFYNEKGHPEVALMRAVGMTANNCGSGGRI